VGQIAKEANHQKGKTTKFAPAVVAVAVVKSRTQIVELRARTWGGERSSIPCKVFEGLDRRDGNVSDEWSGHDTRGRGTGLKKLEEERADAPERRRTRGAGTCQGRVLGLAY
jgi:hypothetical protein